MAEKMINDDKERFAGLLVACGEIFNRQFSPLTLELFWSLLKSHEMPDVERALRGHMADSSFMPTPHDLLKRIQGGTADERAALAWPHILDLLKEPMMSDYKTLLPDGAAALAAREFIKARVPRSELPFRFEFFKLNYRRFFEAGYHESPLVFEWPRTMNDTTGKPERAQAPVIFPDFWPPSLVRRHRAALERFKPDDKILARGVIEGGESRGAHEASNH